ncbi:MAG: hypothetical protein LBP59_05255 [Planctomycetaceae bacterium]|nr:hypothetical protein [Planctomycetaceae bacterium]
MRKTFLCFFGAMLVVGLVLISTADIFAQPNNEGRNRDRDRGQNERGDRGERGNRNERGDRNDRGDRGGRNFGGPGAGGNFLGGGSGLGILLQNENAKKHLNLTEDQTTKLQKIAEEQRNNFPRFPRNNNENNTRPTQDDLKKFGEAVEKYQADTQKKVNEILTQEQQTKFKTLPFQVTGGLESRFLNARSFDFLDLSEDQKAKFKQIEEENQAEFRRIFTRDGARPNSRPTNEDVQKQRDEMQKRREQQKQKLLALLTPEQKALAEKLTAEAKQLNLQPQRNERNRGERNNRDRNRNGRERGNNEYRPNNDSWKPGSGTPENNNTQQRRFPRGNQENTTPTTPSTPPTQPET